MSAVSVIKEQRTHPQYELLYHPGIPGRGEFVRLAFEAAGVPYTDVARDKGEGYSLVMDACDQKKNEVDGNPPGFAPPMLRVPGAGSEGGALLISQTPNILAYLAPKIGLVPDDEGGQFHVTGIAMTALDLNNEAHDTHHPVAVADYYENQKEESLRKSIDFRKNRVPKYFSYFERLLKGNEDKGKGNYLIGGKLSVADTTVFQVVDGLYFAFPKEMQAREQEFPLLLGKFYPGIKEENGIKDYLASDRRQKYSMGVFRHYPELDRQ